MKVMITGAAGFIGSQLAYQLWKNKEELILIDNFSYGSLDNLTFDDCDFTKDVIRADVRNKELMEHLFSNNDIKYVYHFAGIAPLPDCQSNPQEAVSVNVEGTINILENARKFGVEKIVFASTNAMYENETKTPLAEKDFKNLPTLIYPNTKYVAERFCQSYCDTYGMNITCLRFANVYGPHIDCLRKQPPFIGYMIRELYYDRVPTFYSNGEQKRDYIYVQDLIDLAIAVRESKGFDCVNVSANKNYSVNELYNLACEIMQKNIKANFNDSTKYWDKYPQLYNGKYQIKSEILVHEVNKCSLCDNSYALERYGWKPKIDIKEGLSRAIEYEIYLLEKLDRS